jgi:hypothetical protein
MDRTEPSKELLKIPTLHSKYLGILTKHKIASKKAHFDYLRMRKVKWEYFTGKMTKDELEEYGWEPFLFTLKSDINTYLEADKDLIKLLEKKVYHEEVIFVIESIMSELKQRTWQLRDFISWEKFVAGQ